MEAAQILFGKVTHVRTAPKRHTLAYPAVYFCFELTELAAIDQRVLGFGYNRRAPFSLNDRDYLDPDERSILEKLTALLEREGIETPIGRVQLLTCPKVFGYVFNPVSFYYVFDKKDQLLCHVAEVANTFHERFTYVLPANSAQNESEKSLYKRPKSFHVSPFYEMQGEYEFAFSRLEACVEIRIRVLFSRSGKFVATLFGKLEPLTTFSLWHRFLSTAMNIVLILPRILWEARKLRYEKELTVYRKPAPPKVGTTRFRGPSLFQRFGRRFVEKLFESLSSGTLEFRLPDGERVVFEGVEPGPLARVEIDHYRFFTSMMFGGSLGAAESFIRGEWRSPDLVSLLELLSDNFDRVQSASGPLASFSASVARLIHRSRRNSEKGSRSNISKHYDLGNDFFAKFLDPSMTYSSALFSSGTITLEDAQREKLRSMIDLAGISAGDRVLEIGCGWGSFALQAVEERDCFVRCITLSKEQKAHVEQLVEKNSLRDRIEVQLCDYRRVQGQFDRIVSIEMIEAVGREYLADYFRNLDRLLKPDGMVALQVITMPEQRYEKYCRSVDFIQKHVFPGSHCPSLEAVLGAMRSGSNLALDESKVMGFDYAETLRIWRARFHASLEQLRDMDYGDDFLRMWDFYLAYCEAGFRKRLINTYQLSFSRPVVGSALSRWERKRSRRDSAEARLNEPYIH